MSMDIKDITIKQDKYPVRDSQHQLSATEFNTVVKTIINILGEKITQDEYDRRVLNELIDENTYYYIIEDSSDNPEQPGTQTVLDGATISSDFVLNQFVLNTTGTIENNILTL